MFEFSNNKRTVMIREEKRFCRSSRFNSTFPQKLDGILHPDEFQQSITNINRACRPTSLEKILIFILFFGAVIGLVTFITGILAVWWRISSLWIPLMSIGFVLMMGCFTVSIFVSSRVYRRCDARLDKAIDAESKKYSTKSPFPTKWRLDMTIYTRRYSTALPTDIQCYLLIEIGHRQAEESTKQSAKSNANASKSAMYAGQTYLTVPPSDFIPSTRKAMEKTVNIKDPRHTEITV